MKTKLQIGLLAAASLLGGAPALASTAWTFNYEQNCVPGACSDDYYNGSDFSRQYYEVGGSSTPVTVYGIYNTNSDSILSPEPVLPASGQSDGSGQLWLGPIDAWNGLGVHAYGEGWDAPDHSTDNNDFYESVLFDFGAGNMVSLDQVTIGWKGTDADISVLAYNPTATDPAEAALATAAAAGAAKSPVSIDNYTNLGSTYSGLLSEGWTHVGDYSNLEVGAATGINAGNLQSRYWLIGALNPQFGSTWTDYNDYFKILTVGGTLSEETCQSNCGGTQVPVPGTLLLMGAGLAALRRGRQLQPCL